MDLALNNLQWLICHKIKSTWDFSCLLFSYNTDSNQNIQCTHFESLTNEVVTCSITLSRDGSRRRRGKNDTPPPVELTLSSSQKVTFRRECGSRRCSHLSDLGSPDIGKGKKKEAKWLAGTPNGSGVPFPSGVVREFLSKSHGRRTIAILLRAKDKRLRHEGLQNPSSQY